MPPQLQYWKVDDDVLETFTTTFRDVILLPFDIVTKYGYVPRNEEEINLIALNLYILDEQHTIST